MNLAKRKLEQDRSLLVCSVGVAHPTVIDVLGYAGFDCFELDREHGAIGVETMEWLLASCRAAGMEPFWRMGKFDEAEVKCALDMGYNSFIIPHVRGAADVERAVAATRYAPRGRRGVGAGRPIRFGLDDPVSYIETAHEDLMVGFMIEEPEAVEEIEKIVQVEGVGMVQLGFWDLSVAYGLPIQQRHSRLVEAADRVLKAARRHGVTVGIPPVSAEDMQYWQGRGARYFEVSSAAGLLGKAAQECVREYSQVRASAALEGV
jgi:4-hydroxy-2-oxoheptanedioate aldolase